MKFISLGTFHEGSTYEINPLSGTLFIIEQAGKGSRKSRSKKISDSLNLCNNPYELLPQSESEVIHSPRADNKAHRIVSYLNFLCRFSFLLARLYASVPNRIFANSQEATAFFRENSSGDQTKLCLPRSFFATKTSLQFSKSGTMFIGVFLPSRSMHAWVIEDSKHADPVDEVWINYRPVAAFG